MSDAKEAVAEDLKEMGKRVLALRLKAQYTSARSLSTAMGGSPSYQSILNWEKGGFAPSKEGLKKLADFLNTTPEYIMYGLGAGSIGVSKGRKAPILRLEDLGLFFKGKYEEKDHDWISDKFGENAFLLSMEDDSMVSMDPLKSIPVGSKALIDPSIKPTNGRVVLVELISTGKYVIRKYVEDITSSSFISENAIYKPFDMTEDTVIKGRVMQVIMDV